MMVKSREHEIIRRWFMAPGLALQRPEIELGSGDDAAVVRIPPGKRLVVSTDVLTAGRHFPADAAPGMIAHRALATNLSDLAAMAAEPLCFTLALTLPEADPEWLRDFSAGLAPLAQHFDCPLVGGDLARGPLQAAIGIHGLCPAAGAVRRDGATPGQKVYLTGWAGDGALGLASLGIDAPGVHLNVAAADLPESCREHFHNAYFRPEPRVAFALAAAPLLASAIDVSDGLLSDAGHLAAASGVGIVLHPERLPFSPAARRCASQATLVRAALSGGDDYELCHTADPVDEARLMAIATDLDVPLTCIGEVISGEGVHCPGFGIEPELAGFDHFAA